MDSWTLLREFGFPVGGLLAILYALRIRMWVPGWYAEELREQVKTVTAERDEWRKMALEALRTAHAAATTAEKALPPP